jgi:hypothetical protein
MIILSNSLIFQLKDNASSLLMKIMNEPLRIDGKQTETEKDFFDTLIGISQISSVDIGFVNAYVYTYNIIQKTKKSNLQLLKQLKEEYPVDEDSAFER